jgi:hypothetical protein
MTSQKQKTLPGYANLQVEMPGGISVAGSGLRSINLERDVRMDKLNHVLVDGRAQDTLGRITAAMEDPARTRAWSLTGPYGSGKSTLALLIDSLLGMPGGRHTQATQLIAEANPALARRLSSARDKLASDGFLTAVTTARQEPFTKTLNRALFSCANRRWSTGKPPRRVAAGLKPLTAPGASSSEYLAAITALASEAPVLLIIDEFGNTLEYLATRSDPDGQDVRGDIFLLQEIAEAGAGATGTPLFTLTLQHQSFLDYSSQSSALQRREWAKIQGRFEDITYGPDLGDAIRLIRSCVDHSRVSEAGMRLIREHGEASGRRWAGQGLNGVLAADTDMFADVYPLHPLTAAVAPLLAAQIGQHDRTLMGFMGSDEPHTVRRFLAGSGDGGRATVCLPQLYDYFFASGRTTMLASAAAGRWIEIDLILSQAHGLDDEDLQILKTVAILNLIDAGGALRASPAMVVFALSDPADKDDAGPKALLRRLDGLAERGFLVYREFSDEYRIWQGTDVDLRARISEARERLDDRAVVKMLSAHVPGAVVAGRHSQRTGMLRHFITTTTDGTTRVIPGPSVEDPADGVLIFHFGDEHDIPAIESPLPAVVGTTSTAAAVLIAGRELLALNELLSSGSLDSVARKEVTERAGQAQATLAATMAGAFSPSQPTTRWCLLKASESGMRDPGSDLSPLDGRSLAAIVSAACDIAYPDTPHIRNEMLGRHQLTSQGAKARRELLAAMLAGPSEPSLGITGYGPERALHEGVLAYLGLHGPTANGSISDGPGRYDFTEPSEASSVAPAWRALRSALTGAVSEWPVDAAFRLLMAPPYGIKAGVVPVIFVAALILGRDDFAIFEEGTYQPGLSPDLIERLLKAPGRYSVKYVPASIGQRRLVLERLVAEFGVSAPGRAAAAGDRNPALLAVTRSLLSHIRGISGYAVRTRRLSSQASSVREALSTARDPDNLLFTTLPTALGLKPIPARGPGRDESAAAEFAEKLKAAIREIAGADAALRAEVTAVMAREFEVPGDLPSLRRALLVKAAGFADAVLEPELRGFLTLALNESLPDDDWLDPVAVRITRVGLANWTDDDLKAFTSGCRQLARSLDRISHLYQASTATTSHADEDIRLITITSGSGREDRLLLHLPSQVRRTAASMAAEAIGDAERHLGPGGGRALLAALAEALVAGAGHRSPELLADDDST